MQKTIEEFLGPINKHFNFLFKQGYQIVYTEDAHTFDNILVILESEKAKIKFDRDRGQISLAIGPVWAKNQWSDPDYIDLDIILAFLEGREKFSEHKIDINNMDSQVQWLEENFYPKYETIISMFHNDKFSETQKQLHIHWEKMLNIFKIKFK